MNQNSKKDPDDDRQSTINAYHHDPDSVLGIHRINNRDQITVYLPQAESVSLVDKKLSFERIDDSGLFVCQVDRFDRQNHYLLNWVDRNGNRHQHYDPYDFAVQLTDFDLYLFGQGENKQIYKKLGAHPQTIDAIDGILFTVWAPNAESVNIIGDFNHWDGRCHRMRKLGVSGVWELFVPGIAVNQLYKYQIKTQTQTVLTKTDPYGQQFEYRPNSAALIIDDSTYKWQDDDWLSHRKIYDCKRHPLAIYEVHLGSWQRDGHGNFLDYRQLAKLLVAHVKLLGFTHIELLPISEHPLDDSLGYQTTGFFAPTSRYGSADDFRYFIDYCHQHELGVILDWPGHFPGDDFALAEFDGTALYEQTETDAERPVATLKFDCARKPVKNFVMANAIFWLREFHIDGLRMHATASTLFINQRHQQPGKENIAAIEMVRELNALVANEFPGALIIADEATFGAHLTQPIQQGGIGFSMRWHSDWMHEILKFMSADPIERSQHHEQLISLVDYRFSDQYLLPLSHDEVMADKGSLLTKMPGDEWQRFANLRLLFTLMYTLPGKKLLFMGNEFGHSRAWDVNQALNWSESEFPYHHGIKTLIKDLNHLYKTHPALHRHDFSHDGFSWVDQHDADHSIISYMRHQGQDTLLIVLNFTPVPRVNYRIGVPTAGTYYVIMNSDSNFYDGSNIGDSYLSSNAIPSGSWQNSIELTVPPLAGLILKL